MTIFTHAISDIFKHRDFIEMCFCDGVSYECICTSQPNQEIFTEAGLVEDIAFSLRIQLPCFLKLNDEVIFREKQYKVIRILTDSANASVTVDLQDLSKP